MIRFYIGNLRSSIFLVWLRRYCTSRVSLHSTLEVQFLLNLPCIFNTSLDSMVYLLRTLGGGDQIFCCHKLIMPSHLAKLCKSAKFKIYFQIGYCTLTRIHLPLMDEQSVKCAIKIFLFVIHLNYHLKSNIDIIDT